MLNSLISNVLPYLPQKFVWLFSRQYIAGESIEEAIVNAKKLNAEGILTTIDVLGEFISTLEEAEQNTREYIDVITKAEEAGVQGNYSLKPTFFGALIDREASFRLIRDVVAHAASYNSFVRIDMEDSPCTEFTIDFYRRLKAEFPGNVGLVFQSYLKRTLDDIKALEDIHSAESPLNFRICKGIYKEPEAIAYKKYEEINQHFLENVAYLLEKEMYVGIASHDVPVVNGALELLKKYDVPKDMYEFQMLYGVTPALRKSIVDAGHKMRVYVPFGKQWFGYSTRRLKENPEMAGVIFKALFKKG